MNRRKQKKAARQTLVSAIADMGWAGEILSVRRETARFYGGRWEADFSATRWIAVVKLNFTKKTFPGWPRFEDYESSYMGTEGGQHVAVMSIWVGTNYGKGPFGVYGRVTDAEEGLRNQLENELLSKGSIQRGFWKL